MLPFKGKYALEKRVFVFGNLRVLPKRALCFSGEGPADRAGMAAREHPVFCAAKGSALAEASLMTLMVC